MINNAGSGLYAGGFGGDRGFLERDGGQYDEPAEVFAWCGGAVLLSKAYLDDVGLFDERLFLYYEDTDLSWRGRLRGWRYWYEPSSVVRHRHAASSGGAGSLIFRYYTERNRVLVLAKNAPAKLAARQGLGVVKRAVGVNVRDLVVRPLTLHGPLREDAAHQRRVLGGYLRLLPVDAARPLAARRPRRHPPVADGVDPHQGDGAVSGRLRVGVYDLYWSTMGGGEQVAGTVAEALSADHDVTLLGPERVDAVRMRERLGADVSACGFDRVLDDVDASHASAEYDLFVNSTYRSTAINRSATGWYYVHFPEPPLTAGQRARHHVAVAAVKALSVPPRLPDRLARVQAGFDRRVRRTEFVPTYARYLANSSFTAGWVERLWGTSAEVLYPPVRPEVGPGEKQPVVLNVGRFFDPRYGHSKKQLELIDAFTSAAMEGWHLHLAGGCDGVNRDYAMAAKRAAVGQPVDLHINATGETVRRLFAEASIYWHAGGLGEDPERHPERFEHFGITVVEAMAAGAVPVVFAAAGPQEIVTDGVHGFHWRTPEELVRRTRQLIDDPDLRRRMSDAARLRADDFSAQRFTGALRALLPAAQARPRT